MEGNLGLQLSPRCQRKWSRSRKSGGEYTLLTFYSFVWTCVVVRSHHIEVCFVPKIRSFWLDKRLTDAP